MMENMREIITLVNGSSASVILLLFSSWLILTKQWKKSF